MFILNRKLNTFNMNKETIDILQKIHPLNQKGVFEILQALKNTNVKQLYVFGSSLTDNCSSFSDIDIAVFLDEYSESLLAEIHRKVAEETSSDLVYDMLCLNEISGDERIYTEIKKGLNLTSLLS